MDLCPDPNLCKILVKCYNERKTDDMDLPGNMAINVAVPLTTAAGSTTAPACLTVTAASNGQTQSLNSINENLLNGETTTLSLDECLVCSDLKRDTVFKVNSDYSI